MLSKNANIIVSAEIADTAHFLEPRANSEHVAHVINQHENYDAVIASLHAKPKILLAILKETQSQYQADVDQSKKLGTKTPLDIDARLAQAEKQYQAILAKDAELIFKSYQALPIDLKAELLFESNRIGGINDKTWIKAKEQMQSAQTAYITEHDSTLAKDKHSLPNDLAKVAAHQTLDQNEFHGKRHVHGRVNEPDNSIHQNEWHGGKHGKSHLGGIANQVQPAKPPEVVTNQAISNTTANSKTNHQNSPASEDYKFTIGKPMAVTVNWPFKHTYVLPTLDKILGKVDEGTGLDLGFTVKGRVTHQTNSEGELAHSYHIDYVGAGVMSNKRNVQISPGAIEVGSEGLSKEGHWGCNGTILPIKLVHHINLGLKGSVSDCSDGVHVSVAPETAIVRMSNKVKPISTMTYGYFFPENEGSFRIPAKYDASINKVIDWADHADKAIDKLVKATGSLSKEQAFVVNKVIPEAMNSIAPAAVTWPVSYISQGVIQTFNVANNVKEKMSEYSTTLAHSALGQKVEKTVGNITQALHAHFNEAGLSHQQKLAVIGMINERVSVQSADSKKDEHAIRDLYTK